MSEPGRSTVSAAGEPRTITGRGLAAFLNGLLPEGEATDQWNGQVAHIEEEAAVTEHQLRKALNVALEREPTIDEIRNYGLDGQPGSTTNFNWLQWRLDLIRAALAASPAGPEAVPQSEREGLDVQTLQQT